MVFIIYFDEDLLNWQKGDTSPALPLATGEKVRVPYK
jgi:hypothetical protein